VLGGLLGLSVSEVYEHRGGVKSLSYWDMRQALFDAQAAGLLDRVIDDHPLWVADKHVAHLTWGVPGWCQNLAWFGYVRLAIDAGYYPITQVVHGRGGSDHAPDHWIMLVGARERREERTLPGGETYGAIEHEVLVSCSSTTTPAEEWVIERDFLHERGGFNVLLARPAR
jgi:hypothetical protein